MRSRAIHFGLLLALAACAVPLAVAQAPSGSESGVLTATSPGTSGGASAGTALELREQVGATVAGGLSTGAAQGVAHGLIALGGGFAPGAPVVFGTSPSHGDRLGGTSLRVLGFGFQDPAVSSLTVHCGALAAQTPAPAANTHVDVLTPIGTSALGNPLGPVDVAVESNLGLAVAGDAYAYHPALLASGPARIGSPFAWRYFGAAPSWAVLAFGGSLPGVGIQIPPLDGALELVTFFVTLTTAKFGPAGEVETAFVIPPNPVYVGLVFEYQMVGLTSLAPLEGCFTNRLVVEIVP